MSNKANREYLKTIQDEYKKANRRDKSVILSHAGLVTGLNAGPRVVKSSK